MLALELKIKLNNCFNTFSIVKNFIFNFSRDPLNVFKNNQL